MEVTQILKRVLPKPLHLPLRFLRLRFWAAKAWLDDQWEDSGVEGVPLPPPLLRFRVSGHLDRQGFLKLGAKSVQDIRTALRRVRPDIYSFRNVLDFGCGCGRVLRWFHDAPPSCHFYRTDMDEQAITWCRKALPLAQFSANAPLPPLPFREETFDLVLAISVFTHLDEESQLAWLKELQRVAQRKAILIFSTHGAFTQTNLSADDLATLQARGFLFKVGETGRFKLDGLPNFYQTAYHTRPYVAGAWSKFFRILDYKDQGLNDYQDLVVLEKD